MTLAINQSPSIGMNNPTHPASPNHCIMSFNNKMCHNVRESVCRVCQVGLNQACSATETSQNFECCQFSYYTFQRVNNKGTNQTADAQADMSLFVSDSIESALLHMHV